MTQPARVTAKIAGKTASSPESDSDAELRSAIVIYLIAERPDGASIGELSALTLDGRKPTEEVERVSAAVSRLEQEGEATTDGRMVIPVMHSHEEIGEAGG
jgi:hypothetical protein